MNHHVATGIVALVSRSVEGLTPDNVTLLDANGRLLSDPSASEGGSITTQMDYRRELESYLASKAEQMLAQVLGPGRAIVRVTADINFQRLREKKETYSPEGRVATSEEVTSNKSNAAGQGVRGPAGTASNSGKQPAGPGQGGGGNNQQEETTKTNFVVSKVTQELEDKIGAVERLTVAAMVDLGTADGAKGSVAPVNFSLADAEGIIKQAVGFKGKRDEIKVSNVKLSPPEAVPSAENEVDPMQYWQHIISIVRNGSLGLAALVALVLGWMVLRRFRHSAQPANAAAQASTQNAPAQQRLVALLEQNPDAIAKVLAGWLEQPERQQRKAA